jgi:hypothetical protein
MSSPRTSSTLLRVAGIGAGLAAGWLVQHLVDAVWRRAVGHPAPTVDDDDTPFGELVLAVTVTGALAALVRLLTTRGTARLSRPRLGR